MVSFPLHVIFQIYRGLSRFWLKMLPGWVTKQPHSSLLLKGKNLYVKRNQMGETLSQGLVKKVQSHKSGPVQVKTTWLESNRQKPKFIKSSMSSNTCKWNTERPSKSTVAWATLTTWNLTERQAGLSGVLLVQNEKVSEKVYQSLSDNTKSLPQDWCVTNQWALLSAL